MQVIEPQTIPPDRLPQGVVAGLRRPLVAERRLPRREDRGRPGEVSRQAQRDDRAGRGRRDRRGVLRAAGDADDGLGPGCSWRRPPTHQTLAPARSRRPMIGRPPSVRHGPSPADRRPRRPAAVSAVLRGRPGHPSGGHRRRDAPSGGGELLTERPARPAAGVAAGRRASPTSSRPPGWPTGSALRRRRRRPPFIVSSSPSRTAARLRRPGVRPGPANGGRRPTPPTRRGANPAAPRPGQPPPAWSVTPRHDPAPGHARDRALQPPRPA